MTKETRKIINDYRKMIIKEMEKRKISQKDLAAMLNVHYSYISKVLSNHNISLITMEKIADALDLKINLSLEYKYKFND